MAGGDFTHRRFLWLEQVAADPDIGGSTCKLAIFIACRFLSRKTNSAWPSQPALAELLGLRTREGVRYCVGQLVAGGHLTVAVSHGRGTSNRYRIILKNIAAQDDLAASRMTPSMLRRQKLPRARRRKHCFRICHPRKSKPRERRRSMRRSISGGSNIPRRSRRLRRRKSTPGLSAKARRHRRNCWRA
jgi:hypothetical protein